MILHHLWKTMTLTTSRTTTQYPTNNSEHNQNVIPHPNTIVLPVKTRPIEELRDGARRTSNRKRTRPQSYINESYSEGETTWEESGELVRGINIIKQINVHMQTDDNDNEARIVSIYHMLAMHDPKILSVPEDDENNGNISTRDALKAPEAEQFKEAIRKEVWDVTKGTGTLVPVSNEEVKAMKKYWQIGTTLKCKRKKKGNGLSDKHKEKSTRRPTGREDTSRRNAKAADLQSNRQTAHLRIHDANCSNTRLHMVRSGHQVSVLKRPATNRRDTNPD